MKHALRAAVLTTITCILVGTALPSDPPERHRGVRAQIPELQRQLAELQQQLAEQRAQLDGLRASLRTSIGDTVALRDTFCKHLSVQGILLDVCPLQLVASKTVFLSSQSYDGNFGGLSGADAKCQALADESGVLSGTYRAWLSDNQVDARDRLTHHPGPYKLPNGIVVAESWNDLVDGTLQHAIDLTEFATSPAGNTAWTATQPNGTLTPSAGTCGNWTNSAGLGGANMGLFHFVDANWTQASGAICTSFKPIYCIEQ